MTSIRLQAVLELPSGLTVQSLHTDRTCHHEGSTLSHSSESQLLTEDTNSHCLTRIKLKREQRTDVRF